MVAEVGGAVLNRMKEEGRGGGAILRRAIVGATYGRGPYQRLLPA